ncbi:MAG: IS982 family transposase [Rikenellaceae bacterium]
MSILTRDKVTEIYCIADDFCQELEKNGTNFQLELSDGKRHRNRRCSMSNSEIITILVCFQMGHFRNFKHFYLNYVATTLKSDFPNQLSYSRFIQLQHRIIVPLTLFVQLVGLGSCTGISFVDSMKISVCHNKRIRRNKVFKGIAEIGKSTMGWFYGFKLHLVCNDKGELIDFCITKGNVDDRNPEVFKVLSKKLFGDLYADKGYISKDLFENLFSDGIHIVTGIKSNMKNSLMTLRDKILLRKRSVIETINDELKNICQIEHSRHRSPLNFLINMIAGLAAYCFFDKKPAIKFEMEQPSSQMVLFG